MRLVDLLLDSSIINLYEVAKQRPEIFYIPRELDELIKNSSRSSIRIIYILGSLGSGKSATLAAIAAKYFDRPLVNTAEKVNELPYIGFEALIVDELVVDISLRNFYSALRHYYDSHKPIIIAGKNPEDFDKLLFSSPILSGISKSYVRVFELDKYIKEIDRRIINKYPKIIEEEKGIIIKAEVLARIKREIENFYIKPRALARVLLEAEEFDIPRREYYSYLGSELARLLGGISKGEEIRINKKTIILGKDIVISDSPRIGITLPKTLTRIALRNNIFPDFASALGLYEEIYKLLKRLDEREGKSIEYKPELAKGILKEYILRFIDRALEVGRDTYIYIKRPKRLRDPEVSTYLPDEYFEYLGITRDDPKAIDYTKQLVESVKREFENRLSYYDITIVVSSRDRVIRIHLNRKRA